MVIFFIILGWKSRSIFLEKRVSNGFFAGESNQDVPVLDDQKTLGWVKIYFKEYSKVAGHGFVLNTDSGQYVTTASHVFTKKFQIFGNALEDLDSIDIITEDEDVLISEAIPVRGPRYQTCNMKDTRRDVGFFRNNELEIEQGFELASFPALVGQRVWMFCSDSRDKVYPLLIPAMVIASSNYILTYKFHHSIHFPGTSGCAIVNSQLEVVGVNVCGNSSIGSAVSLSSIKESLSQIQ